MKHRVCFWKELQLWLSGSGFEAWLFCLSSSVVWEGGLILHVIELFCYLRKMGEQDWRDGSVCKVLDLWARGPKLESQSTHLKSKMSHTVGQAYNPSIEEVELDRSLKLAGQPGRKCGPQPSLAPTSWVTLGILLEHLILHLSGALPVEGDDSHKKGFHRAGHIVGAQLLSVNTLPSSNWLFPPRGSVSLASSL